MKNSVIFALLLVGSLAMAESAKELKAQKSKTEGTLKRAEKEKLKREIETERLNDLLSDLKAEIASAEQQLKITEDENDALRKEEDSLRKELETIRKDNSGMLGKLEDLKKDKLKLKKTMDEKLADIKAESKVLREKTALAEKAEKEFMTEEIETGKAVDKHKKDLTKTEDQWDAADKSTKLAKNRMEKVKDENADLLNRMDKLNKAIAKLDDERRGLDEARVKLTQQNQQIRGDIETLSVRAKVAEASRIEREKKLNIVTKEFEKLDGYAKLRKADVDKKENAVEALRAKIKTFEEEIENVKKENEDLIKRSSRATTELPVLQAQIGVLKQRYARLADRNKMLRNRVPATAVK
jgi:chromosome segregation ATPase